MHAEPATFPGFRSPTTTAVPDELFDMLMPMLSGAELKVLLYIVRRTFGFKKDADRISLSQLVRGIRTADGRRLDGGTGLSKAAVAAAVKTLGERGVITAERQQSPERGNEPTTYQLRFLTPVSRDPTRGSPKTGQALVQDLDTQQTAKQQTARQHHQPGGVVQELIAAGLTARVAERLAGEHDSAYVRAKLDVVRWLQQTRSRAVARNAAGYLRRAIEDDYPPPPEYRTLAEREAREEARARAHAQAEAAIAAADREREEKRAAEEDDMAARLAAFRQGHPPTSIPGTPHTTETAWRLAMERLTAANHAGPYRAWLAQTFLLSCDRSTGFVVAPTAFVVQWLARRFGQQMQQELAAVLGFAVQIQYRALPDLAEPPVAPAAGSVRAAPTRTAPGDASEHEP